MALKSCQEKRFKIKGVVLIGQNHHKSQNS